MKKHFWRILTVLLMACLGMGVLAACGDGVKPETPPETYTVAFSLGSPSHAAEGVTAPPQQTGKKAGDTITLTTLDAAEDWKFDGWSAKSGKVSGTTYTVKAADAVEGTITLTAQWAEDGEPAPSSDIEGVWSGGTGDVADFTITIDVDGDTAHVVMLRNADDSNFVCMYLQLTKSGDGNFGLNGVTLTVDGDGHLVYGTGMPGQSPTFTTKAPLPAAPNITGTKYALHLNETYMTEVFEINFGSTPAIKRNVTSATEVSAVITVGGYKILTGTMSLLEEGGGSTSSITVIAFTEQSKNYAAVLMGTHNRDRFDLVDIAPTFSVTYDNGDAGEEEAENMPGAVTQKYKLGQTYTISNTEPTWEGHNFKGWKANIGIGEGTPGGGSSVSGNDQLYHGGDTFTFTTPTNVTFVAQWDDENPSPATTSIENVWAGTGGAPSFMDGGSDDINYNYEVSVQLAQDGQSGYAAMLLPLTEEGGGEPTNAYAFGFVLTKSGDNFTGTPKWVSYASGSGVLTTFTITFSVANDNLTIEGFTDDPLVLDKERGLDANISPSGVLYSSEDNYEIDFTNKTLKIDGEAVTAPTFTKVGKFVLICYTGDNVGGADASLVVFEENGHYCYYGTEAGNTIELTTTPPTPTVEYTVKFYKDKGNYSGEPYKTITVTEGETITEDEDFDTTVTNPTKDYYDFAGWKMKHNESSLEGVKAEAEYAEEGDEHIIIVYADWEQVEALPSANQTPDASDNKIVIGTDGSSGGAWGQYGVTNPVNGLPSWVGKIKLGETVTMTGTVKGLGDEVYQGVVAHVFYGLTLNGVNGGVCMGHINGGARYDLWSVAKTSADANAENVMNILKSTEGGLLTVKWDWSKNANSIEVTLTYQGQGALESTTETVTYVYTGFDLTDHYTELSIGLGADNGYAEITHLERTTTQDTSSISKNLVISNDSAYVTNIAQHIIKKGEKFEFTGSMTAGDNNAWGYNVSFTGISGLVDEFGNPLYVFRPDNCFNLPQAEDTEHTEFKGWCNTNGKQIACGWTIGISSSLNWEGTGGWTKLSTLKTNCATKLKIDWTDESKIVVRMEFTDTQKSDIQWMQFEITATSDALAESYIANIGADHGTTTFTSVVYTPAAE